MRSLLRLPAWGCSVLDLADGNRSQNLVPLLSEDNLRGLARSHGFHSSTGERVCVCGGYSKREGAVLRGILFTATEHGVVRVALNDQLEPLVGRRIPLNDYTSEVPRSQTTLLRKKKRRTILKAA